MRDVLSMCTVEDIDNPADTDTDKDIHTMSTEVAIAKKGDRIITDGFYVEEMGVVTSVEKSRGYYDPAKIIYRYNVKFDDGRELNLGDRFKVLS